MLVFLFAPKFTFSGEMNVAFFDLKGTGLPEEKSKEISDRMLSFGNAIICKNNEKLLNFI